MSSSPTVHPSAIIDRRAELDPSVSVGPYAIIDGPVKIGAGTVVGPHVHLSGNTTIGRDNQFHIGAVIGYLPQDLKYTPSDSGLIIGDRNIFREYSNVHRGTEPGSFTRLGSDIFMMAFSHVAHNCTIHDHVVICNGAAAAGHCVVEEYAFLSGNVLLHQYVRMGKSAMMSGGGKASMDVPPYTIAGERNECLGLNLVGLRRRGATPAQVRQMRELFKIFYRSGLNVTNAIAAIEAKGFTAPQVQEFLAFVRAAKRGVVPYQAKAEEAVAD